MSKESRAKKGNRAYWVGVDDDAAFRCHGVTSGVRHCPNLFDCATLSVVSAEFKYVCSKSG